MWPALVAAMQMAQGQQGKNNAALGGIKPVDFGEGITKPAQPGETNGQAGGFLSMIMNQLGQKKPEVPGSTPGGYGKVGTF